MGVMHNVYEGFTHKKLGPVEPLFVCFPMAMYHLKGHKALYLLSAPVDSVSMMQSLKCTHISKISVYMQ